MHRELLLDQVRYSQTHLTDAIRSHLNFAEANATGSDLESRSKSESHDHFLDTRALLQDA